MKQTKANVKQKCCHCFATTNCQGPVYEEQWIVQCLVLKTSLVHSHAQLVASSRNPAAVAAASAWAFLPQKLRGSIRRRHPPNLSWMLANIAQHDKYVVDDLDADDEDGHDVIDVQHVLPARWDGVGWSGGQVITAMGWCQC